MTYIRYGSLLLPPFGGSMCLLGTVQQLPVHNDGGAESHTGMTQFQPGSAAMWPPSPCTGSGVAPPRSCCVSERSIASDVVAARPEGHRDEARVGGEGWDGVGCVNRMVLRKNSPHSRQESTDMPLVMFTQIITIGRVTQPKRPTTRLRGKGGGRGQEGKWRAFLSPSPLSLPPCSLYLPPRHLGFTRGAVRAKGMRPYLLRTSISRRLS